MNDDFVTRLGAQLREAADREAHRGAARRAAAGARWALPLQPVLVAAALVVALVVGVAAVRVLREDQTTPSVGPAPHVVVQAPLVSKGGNLATGFGAVWAADIGTGQVLRVDPATRRVRARISVGGEPVVRVASDAVWAVTNGRLLRIDPATNRVTARIGLGLSPGTFTVPVESGRALWLVTSLELIQIDPRRNAIDRRVDVTRTDVQPKGLAVDDRFIYVDLQDGTLLTFDVRTGARVARSRPAVGGALIAAHDGTLYYATADGAAAVEPRTARVVWRRSLGARGINNGIVTPDGVLWLEGPDARTNRDRMWRVDARTGRVRGSVGVPDFGVTGLAAVGRGVWRVAPGGTLVVVD